jgi:anthranilate phosphoribosyltransferase
MLTFLHRVAAGASLNASEAEEAMNSILAGEASTAQIAAFLVALKMKGETADELVGFARAMRGRANRVAVDLNGRPLVDTCGTGGDALGTFSVSTIVAFVLAGAGVHVAKHGNRGVSSKAGSADLMEALGVRVGASPEESARAIREARVAFLFAPAIHPAMKHAQTARAELKMRTVFNLLGPLTNPAGATHQLIGAPSPQAAALMAEALARLGTTRSLIVHGRDGMDEITTTAETDVWEVTASVRRLTLSPEDFGVPRASLAQLRVESLAAANAVLAGERGPARDLVLVNAAAALVTAGRADDWKAGVAMAEQSIDTGAARAALEALRAF